MDHENIQIKVYEFLDGESSGEEARSAQEHLQACSECRSEAEAWSSARTALLSDFRHPVPLGFSDRVMRKLEERSQKRSWLPEFLALPRWELLATFASLALMVLYFGFDYTNHVPSGNPFALEESLETPGRNILLSREIAKADLAVLAFDGVEEAEGSLDE